MSGAIFLSYASQDAEAARRVCEALRGVGIEVWFDQEGGLEHGDEWDAKIRRQIKECVLFIPVISAATQGRLEGYFRIEWDLAAERAQGIAQGVAFILPVVIDETREPEALVPDRFRKVQWTRLPEGSVPPEVAARILKLYSHRTAALAAGAVRPDALPPRPAAIGPGRGDGRRKPRAVFLAAAAGVVAVAVAAFWLARNRPGTSSALSLPPAMPASTGINAGSVGRVSPAAQLAARAFARTQNLAFTREDLASAEDSAQQATTLEPALARAWGVRAWVQAAYVNRNWDKSAARLQAADGFARRALSLDPDEPEALNAQAQVLMVQGAYAGAEAEARHAMSVAPDNHRSCTLLAEAVADQGREDEALSILKEGVRRFPTAVLVRYSLTIQYMAVGEINPALEQVDAIIADRPFTSALVLKARLAILGKGDLTAMRAALDRLERMPMADRTEDRAVYVAAWGALLERKPDRVLSALALTVRPYFEDSVVASPKAWLSAQAQQMAGRQALARRQWEEAASVLRQRLSAAPNSAVDAIQLAATLGWLGKNDEAARVVAPFEAAAREQPLLSEVLNLARYYAALGEVTKTCAFLRLKAAAQVSPHSLRLEPWWDRLRGQPEFETVIADKLRTLH